MSDARTGCFARTGYHGWDETAEHQSSSGWLMATIVAVVASALLALAIPYPLVLPGGAVASPGSWLCLLAQVLLPVAAGVLSRLVARAVPAPLACVACAGAPTVVVAACYLWCVPAFLVLVASALCMGLVVWVVWHRGGRGSLPQSLCAAMGVLAVGTCVLMPVGEASLIDHPELFAAGYASVGGADAQGPLSGVAEPLAAVAEGGDAAWECETVVVAPFCTDMEGRLISRGRGPNGESVLLVASEYLGDYTTDELSDLAGRVLGSERDIAVLYTRWLDGRLWLWANGEATEWGRAS